MQVEYKAIEVKSKTTYGPERLSWYLKEEEHLLHKEKAPGCKIEGFLSGSLIAVVGFEPTTFGPVAPEPFALP